jgi:hypothetical protein
MESAEVVTEELVNRSRRVDQVAWDSAVDSHTTPLWWVAGHHRLANDNVANAVQTTWLRCVEHHGDPREPRTLGARLVATSRRESLRARCIASRAVPADLALEPPTHQVIPAIPIQRTWSGKSCGHAQQSHPGGVKRERIPRRDRNNSPSTKQRPTV